MRCKGCNSIAHLHWNPHLNDGTGDWDLCDSCLEFSHPSQFLSKDKGVGFGEVEHYLLIDEEF